MPSNPESAAGKLGLGTVQFGIDYGISNREGRTPPEEVSRILALARTLGVSVLDTAPLYGSSEAVLGERLGQGHDFRLVTKTCKFEAVEIGAAEASVLAETFQRSLDRLRVSEIYGLMAHDSRDLLKPGADRLLRVLGDLKASGRVARIGASVYSGSQIDELQKRLRLDLVQVPVNVLDQRLIRDGRLERLKREGCEVHARSAFLQGALLMNPDALPPYFGPARAILRAWRARIAELGLTPQRAALGFVASLAEVDVVVCGVNTAAQLAELGSASGPLPVSADFSEFACEDETVLNPSLWRT